MKKLALATALIMAFGATTAMARGSDDDNVARNNDGSAVAQDKSIAIEDSFKATAKNSFNQDNDQYTKTDVDVDVTVKDSFNTDNSKHMTSNSWSLSKKVVNISKAEISSDQKGHAGDVTIGSGGSRDHGYGGYGRKGKKDDCGCELPTVRTGNNDIGSASFNGIGQFSQNTGLASMAQQSVNVQANLRMN
ncbi:hypothetical protein [Crenobacter luteus]|nr:hypothetical protein [Crenobacter luteus]